MTYRIKNWDDHFETEKTRQYRHCQRITFTNNLNKIKRTRILKGRDGPGCLAVWFSICQWHSTQSKPRKGYLTDNGKADGSPLDADDIGALIGIPARIVNIALQRLATDEIGWVEEISVEVGLQDDHPRLQSPSSRPLTPLRASSLTSSSTPHDLKEEEGPERSSGSTAPKSFEERIKEFSGQVLNDKIMVTWEECYPGVDIKSELIKWKTHWLSNPRKAPKSNFTASLNNWLKKAANPPPWVNQKDETIAERAIRLTNAP